MALDLMTSVGDTSPTTSSDLWDQLTQAQADISRAQQTIRQIQNATGTGIGNTTPARTKSGITIPPVSSVSVIVSAGVAGETQIQVSWVDATAPTGATVDHYNVYVQSAFGAQSKPTLIGASQQSPFVGAFQPSAAVGVIVYVQTVLSNGQTLPLSQCPTSTFMATAPSTSVLSLLQGFIPQTPATLTMSTLPAGGVSNVLTVSHATGGALMSVGMVVAGGTGFITFSGAVGLRLTLDGSAGTILLTNPGAQILSSPLTLLGPVASTATSQANSIVLYIGVGFATSCKVDVVTSANITMSGSLSLAAFYSLHT